jgi:hypothetical protein
MLEARVVEFLYVHLFIIHFDLTSAHNICTEIIAWNQRLSLCAWLEIFAHDGPKHQQYQSNKDSLSVQLWIIEFLTPYAVLQQSGCSAQNDAVQASVLSSVFSAISEGCFKMRFEMVGYYELFGYNRASDNFDQWIGTGTKEAARAAGAHLGGFLGFHRRTADGWAYRVPSQGHVEVTSARRIA